MSVVRDEVASWSLPFLLGWGLSSSVMRKIRLDAVFGALKYLERQSASQTGLFNRPVTEHPVTASEDITHGNSPRFQGRKRLSEFTRILLAGFTVAVRFTQWHDNGYTTDPQVVEPAPIPSVHSIARLVDTRMYPS